MDKCTAPELIQEIPANTTTSTTTTTTTKMPGEEGKEVFHQADFKNAKKLEISSFFEENLPRKPL